MLTDRVKNMRVNFVLLLSLLLGVSHTSGKHLDDCNQLHFLYESFQCVPNYNDGENCPNSYDCSAINQHADACFFNGKHYSVGESARDDITWESCLGCECKKDDNITSFLCYSGSCRNPTGLGVNCVDKVRLGECCPNGAVCPPFSECLVEGQVFREDSGKFSHPKDKCTRCVCEKGTGDEGVVKCQKDYCLDLLRHQREIKQNCAPSYDDVQNDCCPYDWICPEHGITFDDQQQGIDGPSCMFGDKVVKKAQKFYAGVAETGVVCECILPPFVTCSSHKKL